MADVQYDEGGYLPGGPAFAWLHPDECLFALEDFGPVGYPTGQFKCRRAGHPTATSDCKRP